mmetsp:Transcript_12238/g.14838  ORF Transcript_12238/g.14838 Transcript_12238/m.14838 type:complete len:113 (-) Transcript_12238:1686-2024(-)
MSILGSQAFLPEVFLRPRRFKTNFMEYGFCVCFVEGVATKDLISVPIGPVQNCSAGKSRIVPDIFPLRIFTSKNMHDQGLKRRDAQFSKLNFTKVPFKFWLERRNHTKILIA